MAMLRMKDAQLPVGDPLDLAQCRRFGLPAQGGMHTARPRPHHSAATTASRHCTVLRVEGPKVSMAIGHRFAEMKSESSILNPSPVQVTPVWHGRLHDARSALPAKAQVCTGTRTT